MATNQCFGCGVASTVEMLNICGQFLCQDCEAKLVESDSAKEDYQTWIEQCREFWKNLWKEYETR